MSSSPLFTLSGVTLQRTRLRELSVVIPQGVTTVLGWSGAGKTSLLNVLAGFEAPETGGVTGNTAVAWVPQRDALWPGCTAREHLTECGVAPAEAERILASLDLGHLLAAKPAQLSRGEQARLAVARALAMPARTLLMDEPLAHVDPARVGRYWRVIREHVRRTGVSLVFATHAAEFALAEAQHALALHHGSLFYQGTVASLYHEPATEELAALLGPANWLTPEEACKWLGAEWPRAKAIRPEALVISPASTGPWTVLESRFCGAYSETELQSTDGARRAFFHRPAQALAEGLQVQMANTTA